jgi:hypothetical protein
MRARTTATLTLLPMHANRRSIGIDWSVPRNSAAVTVVQCSVCAGDGEREGHTVGMEVSLLSRGSVQAPHCCHDARRRVGSTYRTHLGPSEGGGEAAQRGDLRRVEAPDAPHVLNKRDRWGVGGE